MSIANKSSTTKIFSKGKHQLIYGEDTTDFEVHQDTNLLINPTRSTYYLEEILYAKKREEIESYKFKILQKHLLFDSSMIRGNFLATNQLFINGWDYGVDDKMPDKLKTTKKRSGKTENQSKVKIYNKHSFRQRLMQEDPHLLVKKEAKELGMRILERPYGEELDIYKNWRKQLFKSQGSLKMNKQDSVFLMEINHRGTYMMFGINEKGATFFHTNSGQDFSGENAENRVESARKLMKLMRRRRTKRKMTEILPLPGEERMYVMVSQGKDKYYEEFNFLGISGTTDGKERSIYNEAKKNIRALQSQ